MDASEWRGPITVVGAGLAGAACARELSRHGAEVRLLDRGRAPGGRMASPELHGRRVDLGAGYFTARDPEFAAVVAQWQAAGLVRPWTDTFFQLAPGRPAEPKPGPVRWSTPGGLRSVVRAVLDGLDVRLETECAQLPAGPVVLAMPDPQAARLTPVPDPVEYRPVIAVALELPARAWPFADAAFVHDLPEVTFLADDGARRGDGAPVLVAHSGPELARAHLDHPAGAVEPMLAGLRRLFELAEPVWTQAHRWTFAQPTGQHGSTFGLSTRPDGRPVGLAGDQWCPDGAPRVESAWRSGTDLARAILAARRE